MGTQTCLRCWEHGLTRCVCPEKTATHQRASDSVWGSLLTFIGRRRGKNNWVYDDYPNPVGVPYETYRDCTGCRVLVNMAHLEPEKVIAGETSRCTYPCYWVVVFKNHHAERCKYRQVLESYTGWKAGHLHWDPTWSPAQQKYYSEITRLNPSIHTKVGKSQ